MAVLLATTRGRGKYSYLVGYHILLATTSGGGGIVMILFLRGDYSFYIVYSKGVSIYIQGADE